MANSTKSKKRGVVSSPLQVVWKNPDDGEEYSLDVSVCPEFGCLILGGLDDAQVQHHIAHAHQKPSGLLSEIGMHRMAASGIPIVQGQTIGMPMRQGMTR